jgi:HEAT repeat protein
LGLVHQLSRLVQATHTPLALIYVANHLTWGDPTLSFCFLRALCHIRMQVFDGLLHCSLHAQAGVPHHPLHGGVPVIREHRGLPLTVRQGVPPGLPLQVGQGGDPQTEQTQLIEQQIRREMDIRQEAQRLLLQTQLQQLIEKMVKDKPELLCEKLRDGTPLERFLAIQVISRRRLPLEKDLIEALRDPDKIIRQAARDALVRICRGTDFGPSAGVSKRGVGRAVEQWRHWLDLQQGVSQPRLTESVAVAGAMRQEKDPAGAVKLVASHGDLEYQVASTESTRLGDQLANATGDEQKAVLERLCDGKGDNNTDALAQAIPKLSDEIQGEAREALTRRLARMTATALRDKLQDDNVELRCAAALACGRKLAKEHIFDLLQLLDDPEMDVILSARVALSELTGEDFGPSSDADRQGRTQAADAWRHWWKERQDRRKK